jgi:hypothetical protein
MNPCLKPNNNCATQQTRFYGLQKLSQAIFVRCTKEAKVAFGNNFSWALETFPPSPSWRAGTCPAALAPAQKRLPC